MRILASLGLALLISGCAMTPTVPLGGALYTGVKGPVTATGLSKTSKRGEACAMSILGIIATGDSSIDAARRAGGIKKISMVDSHGSAYLLGLYSQTCTVVYGR